MNGFMSTKGLGGVAEEDGSFAARSAAEAPGGCMLPSVKSVPCRKGHAEKKCPTRVLMTSRRNERIPYLLTFRKTVAIPITKGRQLSRVWQQLRTPECCRNHCRPFPTGAPQHSAGRKSVLSHHLRILISMAFTYSWGFKLDFTLVDGC